MNNNMESTPPDLRTVEGDDQSTPEELLVTKNTMIPTDTIRKGENPTLTTGLYEYYEKDGLITHIAVGGVVFYGMPVIRTLLQSQITELEGRREPLPSETMTAKQANGYNQALEDQITFLKQQLEALDNMV